MSGSSISSEALEAFGSWNDQSAETFEELSDCFKSKTKKWLKVERKAQSNRSKDCTAMDIYDTTMIRHMGTYSELYAFC